VPKHPHHPLLTENAEPEQRMILINLLKLQHITTKTLMSRHPHTLKGNRKLKIKAPLWYLFIGTDGSASTLREQD
jgi:hypothetical protein